MPRPRKRLVSLDDTPYYHCVSRCVRRAFLCGRDAHSGYDFEHRRQWIVDRIDLLSSVFAIDVCAYAVLSNHYHVVLHIDPRRTERWSSEEVARRWLKLFSGPPFIKTWLAGQSIPEAQQFYIEQWLAQCRNRLFDLSWFMRCLNEPIARLANAEDECTGRFWEGRFKSQALLDEQAILSCMAYVDLNPVRAKVAATPEASDFTSIQRRIHQPEQHRLMPFAASVKPGRRSASARPDLPFTLVDYLGLVDWAGRVMVPEKRGSIAKNVPPILHRLNVGPDAIISYLKTKPDLPIRAFGSAEALRSMAKTLGVRFLHSVVRTRELYPSMT